MYLVKGKVIKGESRGQTLGYPTANIDKRYFKLHPIPKGVYAARTTVDSEKHHSIVIIGAPFKKNKKEFKIEVYLLKFKGNLRGLLLEAELVKKLRDLRIFFSEEELINQIQDDICKAKTILSN